jgi:hypothetical protein
MSIDEILTKLDRLEGILKGPEAAQIVELALNDVCADVANRVIETGKDSDNRSFTPYSNAKYPAFWYSGRSRNASGEARVKAAAKKKQGISYAEFRVYNGLPIAFKNFSFNNTMWRGFGVKSVERRGNIIVGMIGGKTEVSKERIENMRRLEGKDIIRPNRNELQRAGRFVVREILRRAGF